MIAVGLCCAAAATAPRAAPADSQDLDQVMAMLALRRHDRVEFIEQQFLSVLSRPLESSGELRYDAPDRLEKRTLKPHAETLVLNGEELTVERAHSRRVMDLHAYPQVLPFVESIRATLAGDRKALERVFRLDFAGSVARWTLTLIPLGLKGQAIVSPGTHRRRARSTVESGDSPAGRRSFVDDAAAVHLAMKVRRARVLVVWLGCVAFAIIVVARAHYITDLSAFLPANPTPTQQLLVDQLRDGPASRLILIAIEQGDAAARARISSGLVQRLRTDPRVLERQ